MKAIHDPFGHGHEGRIGVDRETFARRKGIAAVLHQFATRGLKALEAAQYEYLITHGFYTTEELEDVCKIPLSHSLSMGSLRSIADDL